MIKKWTDFKSMSINQKKCDRKIGYCYVVRFCVIGTFYLTKIGATSCPTSRIANIPRKKICYISPPHYNYYENEELLHNHFSKYRIPRKPGGKSQVELFNIDLPYFFKHLPDLAYETDIEKCNELKLPSGASWYKKDKRLSDDQSAQPLIL